MTASPCHLRSYLLAVLALLAPPPAARAAVTPRIANGLLAHSDPAVGMLLFFADGAPNGSCSGTMIGCDTFLTAAHCVCVTEANTAAECMAGGIVDPAQMQVFLQHGGFLDVASVAIHENFDFSVGGDVAVLKLTAPVRGIAPVPINRTTSPGSGTAATIIGFGTNGIIDSVGLKRTGKVRIAACVPETPNDRNVCFTYREPLGEPGSNSDTCSGDSGGPVLVDFGAGTVVAGITSGGSDFGCLPPDDAFNTDVYFYRDFISSIGGEDIERDRCGDLPHVGDPGVAELLVDGMLSPSAPRQLTVDVPVGTRLLRVALNGETGTSRRGNDFDLAVRFAAPPSDDEFDCESVGQAAVEVCEIAGPRPGTWHVRVNSFRGTGEMQLTMTTFPGCVADCDANGQVDFVDLDHVIAVALAQEAASACASADSSGDDQVTIEEIVAAVRASAGSCPPAMEKP